MSLRKYGTGEILPEEDDLQKTASTSSTPQERSRLLTDVLREDADADHEESK